MADETETKKEMSHTTPEKITGRIRYFRDLIAPGSEVVRVHVVGSGKINNCFPNVQAKIKAEGGEMVIGWCIWQAPKFIEAEYHSVWKKDGQLLDITPKADGEKEIVFFADPKATHIPREIAPNVYERLEPNRILYNGENQFTTLT